MPIGDRPQFLAGLIGAGIQRSLSPTMHEREGQAQGLNYQYRILDIEQLGLTPVDLPRLLEAAKLMGFGGLNVTHPCKQAIIPHLDELSPDAKALGAVNTVVIRDGRTIGHNTDWWGFAEGFKRGLPGVKLDRAVQLGAGGAGAAVAHALLTMGVGRLAIFDMDPTRAARLAEELCERFGAGRAVGGSSLEDEMAATDGLVHCTPTGMAAHPGLPLDAALLRPAIWVSEIVYFPLETELLATARKLGCKVVSGGGMAVFQAVGAFQHFTGLEADAARMLAHFEELQAAR
ncbi:shikimate dehydrogenase [Derxia gummosa]|uniref:Shikimate dehydrogenase (NADP(+)) n=1 Tax=Derxia gummosa DSM 723 TaxID=1121388 RepID=A0A8B6X2M0_9BURK|nr:shikimate dehydrogenase [Derxia gummosa]